MADHGYRVVIHDQLGNGRSDKPRDKSLWTIARYVEEVEAVRQALNLGRVHLLGQSWGTWLGIEYLLLNGGGPSRDNLRRFARELMPAFADAPKVLVAE